MHARTQSVWYNCNKYCFILYFCGATTSSIPGLQSHMSARFRSTHLAPFRSPQAPCSALLRAIILLRRITYHTLIHRKRVTHTAFPHAYLSTSLTRKVQLRRLTAVFRKKTLDPAIPQILCYRKMVAVHPYVVSPDQSRLTSPVHLILSHPHIPAPVSGTDNSQSKSSKTECRVQNILTSVPDKEHHQARIRKKQEIVKRRHLEQALT